MREVNFDMFGKVQRFCKSVWSIYVKRYLTGNGAKSNDVVNSYVILISFTPTGLNLGPSHFSIPLQWRHNGRDDVSNHQPDDCLLKRLFRRRSKKISQLCVTGLCAGNSPVTGEFPAQMAGNVENVSIWWRHHAAPGLEEYYSWCTLRLCRIFSSKDHCLHNIYIAFKNIHKVIASSVWYIQIKDRFATCFGVPCILVLHIYLRSNIWK